MFGIAGQHPLLSDTAHRSLCPAHIAAHGGIRGAQLFFADGEVASCSRETAFLAAIKIIPVEGVAILLGVDRFMSEARAITNVIGNGVATIVIAKSEGEFVEQPAERGVNE